MNFSGEKTFVKTLEHFIIVVTHIYTAVFMLTLPLPKAPKIDISKN